MHDVLLASAVNGGGVFLVEGAVVERLSRIDTTGIATIPGGVLLARQAEGIAELRRLAGREAHRIRLVERSLDLHDVLWDQDHTYLVSTTLNAVFRFDAAFVEVERWTLPGEDDSQHVNSLCLHEGRLLASRFGRFDVHRGYKGATRGAGEIFDVKTGEVVIGGLSQPHSLVSHAGRLWVCDSEAGVVRAYHGFVETRAHAFDGYVRGLAFGASAAFVGLSRSRNTGADGTGTAAVLQLDLQTLEPVARIDIPTAEIYDLRVVDRDVPLADLRAAALADALAEFDTLGHARNVADGARYEAELQSQRLAHEVARLVAEKAQLDTRIAATGDDLSATTVRLLEERAWSGRLAAEGAALRAGVLARDDALAACGRTGDALRARLGAIERSRAWSLLQRLLPPLPSVPPDEDGGTAALPTLPPVVRRADQPVLGLAFEEHAAPRVSIIVTAYGHFAETDACLRAIQASGDAATFEVLLVEDQSGEEEMQRFRTVPGLRYIANPRNVGFLRSVNAAADRAQGEFIHLLNNDTRVQPGWLDALLDTFVIFHDCGLAGSCLLYPDGRLQEAGAIVWSDGDAFNFGRGDDPGRPAYRTAREVDYVSGASVVMRTELWRRLGGFDERFQPAYYEDTDLAMRIREAGLRVYLQPSSRVVHQEGLSHGTDATQGHKAGQVRNRRVFLERWEDVLSRDQLPPGQHLYLAKDRGQRKRSILVVDRHLPHTDRDAGSRAIWQLLRVLHLHGLDVKFWPLDGTPDPLYAGLMAMHGYEVVGDGADPAGFERWIAAHGAYVDHVLLSRPLVADAVIDAVRRHSRAPVIYYGHDIHHRRIERELDVTGAPGLREHARHLQWVEASIWARSDLVLYPAAGETHEVATWLAATGASARAATVPLFAYEDTPPLAEGPGVVAAERRNLVFVGGYAHAPNADAAVWFTREVWPLVKARIPDCRLRLIGADPGAEVRQLASAEVAVTGYLSEGALNDEYRNARVALAPLRFGAGTKGKVLEAMRLGIPCVVTPTGAQGLEDAAFLRVADDAEGLAAHIEALFADDESWLAASAAAQAFVRERYSVHTVWAALRDAIEPGPYADVATRLASIAAVRAPVGDPAGEDGRHPP